MIDIHSHILPGIDDGSSNIEESINIIKKLKNTGFDKIILTPHYIKSSKFNANNDIKNEKLLLLKKELNKNNIDIDLYLGNEIYITLDILDLYKKDEIYSLNKTKYFLIELPINNEINNILDYFYELKLKGYIPVLAHPERYSYFDKEKLLELKKEGILLQFNLGSILGIYGNKSKKLFKYALKKDLVDFLGTDIHRDNSILFNNLDKCLNKIEKIIGKEKLIEITEINPKNMFKID